MNWVCKNIEKNSSDYFLKYDSKSDSFLNNWIRKSNQIKCYMIKGLPPVNDALSSKYINAYIKSNLSVGILFLSCLAEVIAIKASKRFSCGPFIKVSNLAEAACMLCFGFFQCQLYFVRKKLLAANPRFYEENRAVLRKMLIN